MFKKELSLSHKLKFCNSFLSVQSTGVKLRYFKLRLFNPTEVIVSAIMGCKDIRIRKSEFVAKNQFLVLVSF